MGVLHMKKLMFVLLLCCAWVLGMYEGDCTFAAAFSLVPLCQGIDKGVSLLRARG